MRLNDGAVARSNQKRAEEKDSDISDAVPGDDMPLTALRNTERGAPYHLINTMLNLVGGSDLATQARASDSFLMSKHFCGSIRTGYRRTSEYACGSISLGTAVATLVWLYITALAVFLGAEYNAQVEADHISQAESVTSNRQELILP